MTGHVPETSGHNTEIIGHAVPKYAVVVALPALASYDELFEVVL